MTLAITNGRRIAESRNEEMQIALSQFNTAVGPDVLKELTRILLRPGKGTLRVQIHTQDHRVTSVQIQPDYTIALDGSTGD